MAAQNIDNTLKTIWVLATTLEILVINIQFSLLPVLLILLLLLLLPVLLLLLHFICPKLLLLLLLFIIIISMTFTMGIRHILTLDFNFAWFVLWYHF